MDEIEQRKQQCLERWNRLKNEALKKQQLYRAGNITQAEISQWFRRQTDRDRRTLKGMFDRIKRG